MCIYTFPQYQHAMNVQQKRSARKKQLKSKKSVQQKVCKNTKKVVLTGFELVSVTTTTSGRHLVAAMDGQKHIEAYSKLCEVARWRTFHLALSICQEMSKCRQ